MFAKIAYTLLVAVWMRILYFSAWFFRILSIPRFYWALWTRKIPRKWITAHRQNLEEPIEVEGKLAGESNWSYIKRIVDPEDLNFVYHNHLHFMGPDIYGCPIVDDLESEVDYLKRAEMPSPKFKKQALRKARRIRNGYAKLLARGVGGTEYQTMWKRNLAVMDRIIEGHHE